VTVDTATLVWALLPVGAMHLLLRRRRELLLTLLVVDVGVAVLLGRLVVAGAQLGAGVPGAEGWGMPATALGSPEQTDLPLQFHIWWEEVRRLVKAGVPPWVSERIGGGIGLFAHGQSGLPFPLHLPVWVLGAELGTVVMAVWKLVLAGLGVALFMGRLGAHPAAVVTAAATWAFHLYLLSWLVVPLAWVVAAAGWVAWALLGTLRGQPGAAALTALLLGVLCGWSVHPESAVFLMGAVALWGAVGAWGRARRYGRVLVPLFLAVAVAGVGALPAWIAITDSAKREAMTGVARFPLPGVTVALRLRVAGQLFVPWRDGHPADGSWSLPFPAAPCAVATGTAPLVLLLAGGVRRRHRRVALGLAAMMVLAALLYFQIPGAAHLLTRLPVLGMMTWVRVAFLIPFGVCILGALGLDAWLRRPRPARLALAAGAVQLAVLAAVVVPPSRSLHRAAVPTAFIPGVMAALAPLLPVAGGAAVPLLAAAEAVAQGWEVLPGVPRSAPTGEPLQILVRLAEGQKSRVLGLGTALPANAAARWGLSDLRAHDPVRPRSLARLHAALGAAGADLAGEVTRPWAGLSGAWGVQWLATPPAGVPPAQAAGWVEVWRGEEGRVYANARVLPVVRLASRAVPSPGDAGTGGWEALDFATTAVVEGVLPPLGGKGELSVLDQRPHRWRIGVRADGQVLALLQVPHAVGWRAFLDRREVSVVTANLGAMGVVVPAGEHQVEWRYAPPGLAAGAALTCVGLWGCLGLALGRRRP